MNTLQLLLYVYTICIFETLPLLLPAGIVFVVLLANCEKPTTYTPFETRLK